MPALLPSHLACLLSVLPYRLLCPAVLSLPPAVLSHLIAIPLLGLQAAVGVGPAGGAAGPTLQSASVVLLLRSTAVHTDLALCASLFLGLDCVDGLASVLEQWLLILVADVSVFGGDVDNALIKDTKTLV